MRDLTETRWFGTGVECVSKRWFIIRTRVSPFGDYRNMQKGLSSFIVYLIGFFREPILTDILIMLTAYR